MRNLQPPSLAFFFFFCLERIFYLFLETAKRFDGDSGGGWFPALNLIAKVISETESPANGASFLSEFVDLFTRLIDRDHSGWKLSRFRKSNFTDPGFNYATDSFLFKNPSDSVYKR